jgi:polyisoprenoid-binding protein YceI
MIMKRLAFLLFVLTFVLTACAADVSQRSGETFTPESPTVTAVATETPHIESEQVETPQVEMEETATMQDEGPKTYQIVPGESQVTYEVAETFLGDNRFAVAVGVTSEVSGEISVDQENPQSSTVGTITVDVSQFVSDSSRRDSAIQGRFLESTKYPLVTFVPTEIAGLPETYQIGDTISFQVIGDATIRETTLPLTFKVIAMLADDVLTGEAGITFLMSDFGFGPISIAGILETEDEVKLTFNFVAKP